MTHVKVPQQTGYGSQQVGHSDEREDPVVLGRKETETCDRGKSRQLGVSVCRRSVFLPVAGNSVGEVWVRLDQLGNKDLRRFDRFVILEFLEVVFVGICFWVLDALNKVLLPADRNYTQRPVKQEGQAGN